MVYGFIGTGNMAGAIIRGVVAAKKVAPAGIVGFDTDPVKLKALADETGIGTAASADELVDRCETVVLSVKPNVIPVVLDQQAAALRARGRLVVSIAAGTPIAALEAKLGADVPIVRVMPNVNAMVGQAMCAVCGNAAATRQQVDQVKDLLGGVGGVTEIDEHLMATFSALAGASPAWTFYFIDALARGGVAGGMPKAQALEIAAQAVKGSAEMILEGKGHPWALIDMVSSPAGTTIAGLQVLEEAGLSPAAINAVKATIARDAEIAAGN
jgi:pyrroline-5-carboxylate reductase